MTTAEARRALRRKGFVLRRQGSRHELWTHPSGVQVTLPHGSKISPRACNQLRLTLKRVADG